MKSSGGDGSPAPRFSGDAGRAVFARAPGAESSVFGDETVLLDPEGRTLRGLNDAGARIWELLDGKRPLHEVAGAIASEFGIAPERALSDALQFVHALQAKGLVVSGGAP